MEMLANFAYYRYINKNGGGSGSMAFLFVGTFHSGIVLSNVLSCFCSGRFERREKLAVLLPLTHHLDGLIGRHAIAGEHHEPRSTVDGAAFRVRR